MEKPLNQRWLSIVLLAAACGSAPKRSPEAFPAPDPESVQQPQPGNGELPSKDEAPLAITQLPNKLATVQLQPTAATNTTAELVLGLAVGTATGKQGLSDLALALLLTNGDATKGRTSLQRTITELGGSIAIEQGLFSTWLTVRLPADRWGKALTALAQALVEPAPGRSQLERLQREHLAATIASVSQDTSRVVAQRLLLGDAGTSEHLAALFDRDAGEALLLHARNFRPEATVIGLRVPADIAQCNAAVSAAFASWNPPTIASAPIETAPKRELLDRLYWATGDAPCRVTLICGQPSPFTADAVLCSVMLNCMTMDGIGGRFERLLQEAAIRDLTWTSDFLGCGESSALLLSTTTTPERAARIWQIAQNARRSLRELPPTESELVLARTRARLTLRRAETEPATSLRTLITRALNQQSETQLQAMLRELEQKSGIDPQALAKLQLPRMAMIVLGGTPPAEAKDAQRIELLPNNLLTQMSDAGNAALQSEAKAWLGKSLDAIGGKDLVLNLQGFITESRTVAEQAPPVDETVRWNTDHTAHRERTVLGATIAADFAAQSWTESSGDTKVQLTPTEAHWQLSELERHPLALLYASACGTLKFRLLANRTIEGRDYVMLEAVGDREGRLRIALESQSALIRSVETWTTSPQGTPTCFVDTWSDHRPISGLRVPFRRVTVVDDGQSRRVTTFSKVSLLPK